MVVALCLMALLVTTGVQAAPLAPAQLPEAEALANPTIRFDPSASTVPPGATFVVNVVVDNAADLGGVQFTMTFDPAVVKVQNVALGSFLGSTGRTVGAVGPVTPTVGTCEFGGFSYGAAAGPNGTGNVASLTLQAVALGSSNLTFTAAQLTDTQWNPLAVVTPTVASGAVTVWVATLGDVNADGTVNSTDALIILSCDVGLNTSSFCPMNCGDGNADGQVNSTDALIILAYDVGMTVPFPVGKAGCPATVTPCGGCNP
jgi:hypothetical protein